MHYISLSLLYLLYTPLNVTCEQIDFMFITFCFSQNEASIVASEDDGHAVELYRYYRYDITTGEQTIECSEL